MKDRRVSKQRWMGILGNQNVYVENNLVFWSFLECLSVRLISLLRRQNVLDIMFLRRNIRRKSCFQPQQDMDNCQDYINNFFLKSAYNSAF